MTQATSNHTGPQGPAQHRLTDRRLWVRGLYMLFFALAYTIAETLILVVAVFQFVITLFTGRAHATALRFGHNLSRYAYQILQFETFNDETLPFPFSDWPDEDPEPGEWSATPNRATAQPAAPSDVADTDRTDSAPSTQSSATGRPVDAPVDAPADDPVDGPGNDTVSNQPTDPTRS